MQPIHITRSIPAHQEAMRIAELVGSAGILTNHGGKVLDQNRCKVFNIYAGSMDFSTVDFDNFSKQLVEGGYYVSPDGKDTTPSKFLGSRQLIPSPFTNNINDVSIAAWLDSQLAQGNFPADDGYTIYSIQMAQGTVVSLGSDQSCSSFCGYHSYSGSGHFYQVICDTSCAGCHELDAYSGRTMVYSHEYGETRSDPHLDAWFNDSTGEENGDECAWPSPPPTYGSGRWVVQGLAVNGQGCVVGSGAVVPPPPPPPISVTITPASAIVGTSKTLQFTANVPVTWTAVRGLIGGSSGAYAAPLTAGSDTVTARSILDPTKFAQATITVVSVTPPPPPPPNVMYATTFVGTIGYPDGKKQAISVALTPAKADGFLTRLKKVLFP